MMNVARVVALDAVADCGVVVVPIAFSDGQGHLPSGVPSSLAGHQLPATLAADWCASHGLSKNCLLYTSPSPRDS